MPPSALINWSLLSVTPASAAQLPVNGPPVVISLPHALLAAGLLTLEEGAVRHHSKALTRQAVVRWNGRVNEMLEEARQCGRLDLARLEALEPLRGALVGWDTMAKEAEVGALRLCTDLELTVVLRERCVGQLYLGRRAPERSWKRLFGDPLSFDDPRLSGLPILEALPPPAARKSS